jgi:hypothetical protein
MKISRTAIGVSRTPDRHRLTRRIWKVASERAARKEDAVEQQGERPHQWPADAAGAARGSQSQIADVTSEVTAVSIMSLRAADSPRLNGEDKAHIMRLAETESELPPILVDRRTMRVIDGMHRLMAASLQGRETIEVRFFEGNEADVFLRAVEENIAHGLPLSQADRRAAAERIIATHPHMSDRAISHCTGLAAKTVAAIRKRSSEGLPQSNARVGRDGRVRPLDSGAARRRAAEMLTEQPSASLRDVARVAGISPATVLDVRKRLERGESPVPEKAAANAARTAAGRRPGDASLADGGLQVRTGLGPQAGQGETVAAQAANRFTARRDARAVMQPDPAAVVEKLLRDPSLRGNEVGRGMLRLLHINAMGMQQLPDVATAMPPHCLGIVVVLAHQYAKMWQDFAWELGGQARIIDPQAAAR